MPLGRLAAEERAAIDAILGETLERAVVLARVRARFAAPRSGGEPVLSEVMEHYGLASPLDEAGFFETEHHRKVIEQVKAAVQAGRLVALSGLVGAGKTVLVRQLQDELAREGKVLVARSLSVDKERVTLQTLMTALFYDLSPEEEPWIPSQGERRERELRDLIRKGRKPVALFVDEAHDLHPKTLRGLKRLGEVVRDAGARLAVVLVGHPKLRNDLRRPTMEEIGHRTTIVDFKGIAGQQRPYIDWLLAQCLRHEASPSGDVITEEAVELLARVSVPRCRSSGTSPRPSRRDGGWARSRSRRSSSRRCSPRSSTSWSRGCAGTATTSPTSPS